MNFDIWPRRRQKPEVEPKKKRILPVYDLPEDNAQPEVNAQSQHPHLEIQGPSPFDQPSEPASPFPMHQIDESIPVYAAVNPEALQNVRLPAEIVVSVSETIHDTIDIYHLVNKGGYKNVHLASWNGDYVAAKTPTADNVDMQRFIREGLEMMVTSRKLADKLPPEIRIAQVYGVGYIVVDGTNIPVILEEWLDPTVYESLHDSFNGEFTRLNSVEKIEAGILALKYLCDFVDAYALLKKVQGDLKPKNIMVNKEDGKLVVTDFGTAHPYVVDHNALSRQHNLALGTRGFVPNNRMSSQEFSMTWHQDLFAVLVTVQQIFRTVDERQLNQNELREFTQLKVKIDRLKKQLDELLMTSAGFTSPDLPSSAVDAFDTLISHMAFAQE